ncbi:MAG: hypothetical protein WAO91_07510 [Candidatus Nitrosotenuis sp.]
MQNRFVVEYMREIPKKNESNERKDTVSTPTDKKIHEDQQNTNQYFRISNGVIKEKINMLKRFQDGMKRFSEGDSLQNRIKSRKDLDNIDPRYITEDDAKELIAYLEEEFEKTQDKLLCQELIIEKTKAEVSAKRKELDEIKEKLEEMLQTRQKIREDMANPIEALKEELRKAGIDDKNQIYQLINEVAETLNMKKPKSQAKKQS